VFRLNASFVPISVANGHEPDIKADNLLNNNNINNMDVSIFYWWIAW